MKTYIASQKLELHRTPLILHIAKEDGSGKIGRAVIREGSITWYTGNAQKGHKIGWKKFDELMTDAVPKRKKRKVKGK